jgi:hypothetical protein
MFMAVESQGKNMRQINDPGLRKACQSPHLAEIQGMKRILKPQLPIEIYTSWEIMPTVNFRKYFSFPREN